MAEILKFEPKRKKKPSLGLCQHGHHKWKADKTTQFDSKHGRLVTRYRCERCGKTKVKAH